MRGGIWLTALFVTLLAFTPAWARAPDDAPQAQDIEKEARGHFEMGQGLFHLGKYLDAIREFEAGYSLVPKPGFLINIGQAYWQLNDTVRARQHFERFLIISPPDHPRRGEVRELVAQIDRNAPPEPAPKPAAEPVPSSPSREKSPALGAVVTATPHRASGTAPRFSSRKFILWGTIVAAAVVATAIATGVGVAAAGGQSDPVPTRGIITFGN